MQFLKSALVALALLTFSAHCNSQTLIMNEVSQGVTGNMEYVEFIVVDTTVAYSCSGSTPPCIDIRGWIFDDNSGYHGAAGIAPGCLRFSYNSLWSCVPMGTIIVIYNGADVNPQLPPDDFSVTDGNCTIIAPVNNTQLFESNSTTPGDVACSYPATGWTPGGSWSNTLLANAGDCARIVNLSGCEVFSVCWSTANQNTLVYFSGGATSGSQATNTVYYFNDGDPSVSANWTIGCADVPACGQEDQTPGAPNNAANAAFISPYNNNCSPIVPIVANALVDVNAGCSCTGQATASGSGSIPGYSFEWLDAAYMPIGQTTATATGLCAGTYYAVVTSSIGCSDTATVTITSSGGTSVAVNSESICSGQSATLTASPSVTGGTYMWSPGGQTSASITVSPAATSTYTVSYDLSGCIATADGTVTVNPAYNTSETISLCSGSNYVYPDGLVSTNITAAESHVSGLTSASGCDSIVTTNITIVSPTSVTQNVTVCSGASYTYPDGTISSNITAGESHVSVLTTAAGCDSLVTVNLAINPVYNLVENITACQNTPVTFPDGTTQTIVAGTSHTSILSSASGCDSIVVTNVGMLPSYTVTESVSLCSGSIYVYPDGFISGNIAANESHTSVFQSSNGCDSLIITNVTITPAITVTENVTVCSGDSYSYPDGTISYGITVSESHVSAFSTAIGCDSLVVTHVSVAPSPPVSAGNNVTICEGEQVTLAASGAISYVWSNGVQNGQPFFPQATATYQVIGTDASGCRDSAWVTVTVGPVPEIALTVDIPSGCAPLTVQLTNSADTQGASVWNLGNGLVMTGSTVSTTYTAPGTFDVELSVSNEFGCTNTQMFANLITVSGQPLAGFTSSGTTVSTLNPEVHFFNTSVNAVDYLWIFPDSTTSNSVDADFTFSGQLSGFYQMTLVAYNEYGCPDTAYLSITLEDELIFYVPNAFTPDGDEYNQVFRPVFSSGYDPFDFTLLIFDRWGELIWESHDVEAGWDGTYANGFHVQDGAYIWKMEFKVNKTDERKLYSGHVNVVR